MSIIETVIRREGGFIAYLTAGDGGMARSKEAMLALIAGGVNILEIGFPFSDPVADGTSIQRAAARALQRGTTMAQVFQLIRDIQRIAPVPVIFFTYYNPLMRCGAKFYQLARDTGVAGCLVVDLPIDEADAHRSACKAVGMDSIFLVAPSTTKDRVQVIAQQSTGMLYYVTRSGTTGLQTALPPDMQEKLRYVRTVSHCPVVAGFGIANRSMAQAVMECADGFVVGSLFVDAVARGDTPAQLTELARSIDPRG